MIDKEVFAQGMGQLAGAFGREIDGPVSRMYYQVLAPHLDNTQFVEAVTRTIASETFWPSPAVLLDKIGADAGSLAQRAWTHLTDTLSQYGGYRYFSHEKYQEFDDATKAGIKAIGGLQAITNCEGDRKWERLKREFSQAYTEAQQPTALPAGEQPAKRVPSRASKDMALPTGDRD